MQIIMVDAVSVNGKITKGAASDTHTWTSSEDWDAFVRLRDACDVLVMGAATYEAVRPTASASLLRVVLTNHPEKYSSVCVPGQLEFVAEDPQALVKRLAKAGHSTLLVAGGSHVNSQFLAAGLVDDVYLTFEPVLFGAGTPLVIETDLEVSLRLQSVRTLNPQGTLLAHYTVERPVDLSVVIR